MSAIADRLREARLQLRLSQEAMAKAGGVHRNTQANYEDGSRVPDAAYLARVSEAGADVRWIVTGEKSAPPYDVAELARALIEMSLSPEHVPEGTNLPVEELRRDAELLQEVHALAPDDWAFVRHLVRRLASAAA